MGIARSATVYVIMAVIVGICGCGTCQHDAYTEPKQHEVELSPRQEVSAHIEETSPPKPEFQDRLQAVEGNALEAKAQREDTRSTFTVDQQIGLSSSETTLTLDSKGVTYRNENMKVDRFIPWSAIIEWQGKYLGKGRPGSPKARTEFFSFRINVNNDAIPREKRHLTIAATGWLTFRFDWRGDAVAAFDLAKQHHPKGTVDMR